MKPIRVFLIIPDTEQFSISNYPNLDIPEVESIEVIDYSSMKNCVISLTESNVVVTAPFGFEPFAEKCLHIARFLELPIIHSTNFSKYVISTNN